MKKKKDNKKRKKIKMYNYLIIFFSLTFILLSIAVVIRYIEGQKGEKEVKEMLDVMNSIEEIDGDNLDSDLQMGKYNIIGRIIIPVINLEYPVLEKTTTESLNLSITKLAGPNLNEWGNVSLAGHKTRNGTLFGNLAKVKVNDIIEIIDSKNKTINYKVYKIYNVNPDDPSPTKQNNMDERELTLITCTTGAKKRLIVKAREM